MSVIIAIGCGRSGTTLLMDLLNRVPGLHFRGETNFLVPRLMSEVWDDKFWLFFNWVAHNHTPSTETLMSDPQYQMPPELLRAGAERAGAGIRRLMREILEIPESAQHWGFKEVWNGGTSFCMPWDPYDIVFPEAHWVGIVRNPFYFARSSAQWGRQQLDLNYLRARLFDWLRILQHSRKRNGVVPFKEIRFEDLVSEPQHTLQFGLAGTGLEQSVGNLSTERPVFASKSATSTRPLGSALIGRFRDRIFKEFPTLESEMKALGYAVPEEIVAQVQFSEQELELPIHQYTPLANPFTPRPTMELVHENSTLRKELAIARLRNERLANKVFGDQHEVPLRAPFATYRGNCFMIKLSEFAAISDSANEDSSFFELYEDDHKIGIPHSLHADIELQGRGRFSHWGEWLFFSTSDNSDPNSNGRSYTLKVELR